MSRVKKPGNKWMNSPRYDASVYGPSKMTRIHCEGEDYHKSSSLSQWLFVKYDTSYKAYRNKSKTRRDELRAEFESDTYEYRQSKLEAQYEYDDAMELLASIGVPFSPDGTPLGIGWDD